MSDLNKSQGVTLLELLVVVLIIGILSTIAVAVYTGQVERARFAAARDTIRQLELAVTRYEVDVGEFPPTSSGTTFSPSPINPTTPSVGNGYMQLALLHSLGGDAYRPLDRRWLGPYLEFDADQLGDDNGNPITTLTPKPGVQILDPWGGPFYYLRATDYSGFGGTVRDLSDPFRGTETFYNPTTVQIFSFGPNRQTLAIPNRGTETDDVNNWGFNL